jgi:hypothetical protein
MEENEGRTASPLPSWQEFCAANLLRLVESSLRRFRGICGTRRGRRGFGRVGVSDRQIFPHFVEALLADAANGQQIVHTFERPVRLAHLQDFLRRRGANSWHLLKLFGTRRIDIDGLRWRLFLPSTEARGKKKK